MTWLFFEKNYERSTLLRIIDQISYWIGKAFAWLILGLTMVVSIEVFKRYILNAPTSWIFDLNNMLYGTLFMMCGAYTLALAGHVRADFVYIYLKPRAQAGLDLALYFLFLSQASSGLSMRATATPPIPGASRSIRM
jgi:TRAP-type mannitol/chloroaromatic compound transport system permease small subunit